jgi:hypothetical protein
MSGDVEAATAKDVEEKGSPTGWLQDENSPAQALWHAALLAATLWSCARAPLALARPARGPSPCDALADLVFVGEVFARLAFPVYDAERRELIDDPRHVRDRYLHSPQLYGNLALALPVVSGYLPLSRATAVLRTLRFTKFKPTLNTLRGTLQRTRDIHVSVELVELAAVLFYLMILMLALGSMRWAPRLPYDTRNLAITIVVVAVSLALHAVAFANLQSAVDAQNVVEASHEKQVGPVLAFLDGADVDDDARQRVRTHFDYLLVQQGGMADDQILAELPASLKRRVKDQSRALLVQVPFFSPPTRSHKFLDAVVDALANRVFFPNQWLVEAHGATRELLILREGVALVVRGRAIAKARHVAAAIRPVRRAPAVPAPSRRRLQPPSKSRLRVWRPRGRRAGRGPRRAARSGRRSGLDRRGRRPSQRRHEVTPLSRPASHGAARRSGAAPQRFSRAWRAWRPPSPKGTRGCK